MSEPLWVLTLIAAAAVGRLLAWPLLRTPRPPQLAAPASDVRQARVEAPGQAQTTTYQILTALQGTLGDLQATLREAKSCRVIEEVRTTQTARQQREEEVHQAVRRIEAVTAGRERRGEAGEQVLAAALRQLPASMVGQNFRVSGSIVEFAPIRPDGRRLPIDSKWTAADLLQRLAETPSGPQVDALAEEVERAVARRAREVAQYISPPATLPWAVAAVPDPAYAVCQRAHLEGYRAGAIVLLSSLILSYLLALDQLHHQFAGASDAERLSTALTQMERHLEALDRTLENSVARAITSLQNASGDLKRGTSDLCGALVGARQPSQGAPTERLPCGVVR